MKKTAAEALCLCGGLAFLPDWHHNRNTSFINAIGVYTKNRHTPTTLMTAPNTSRKVTF